MISKYIAFEFFRYFMLFLSAFVLMTMIGNFFGNLGGVFSDWLSFLEFLKETALLLPILFELIIEYNIKKKLNLNKKEYNIILSFIKNLITFNTTKRYSPQKALNEYKKIIKILK